MISSTVIIDLPALIKYAELKPGDKVADLGTGREGKMAVLVSRLVGDSGIVYAVDVVKDILPAVATKARMQGLNNIQTVWSNLEIYNATRAIRDNILAAAFLVTVLFQSKQRKAILQESMRMIRPGGKLIVADWKPGIKMALGPGEQLRVQIEEIKQYANELGLRIENEFEAGQYHWGLVLVK
ncbi:MAG: class I SAM-dependent methyltransferase [Patescibacteria group bacterium]|jgi:ubiquinone/menaquinone biosynthesis C-methylase UbiE